MRQSGMNNGLTVQESGTTCARFLFEKKDEEEEVELKVHLN
jgi:hypothetical protein